MAKTKTTYVCSACGYSAPRWTGQCPSCRAWNTMEEDSSDPSVPAMARPGKAGKILDLATVTEDKGSRWSTGIGEFDRVLGGGVVPGSVVLSGGEPGVGKSTLLLQVAGQLLKHGSVLYVSGEESPSQIRMRADRLAVPPGVRVMAETEISAISAGIREMRPQFLVIDSIQTLYDEQLSSAPGSVTQVRACAAAITRIAKTAEIPAFIIGHVTKEGTIAGPRVVEHLVDTVLYFEGERTSNMRVLRAVKNRFGGTDEIGLFEMTDEGMREAQETSFLMGMRQGGADLDGAALYPATQGARPMLLEVQALCADTQQSNPRRMSSGIDANRLYLLCAVLEKKIGFKMFTQDVFLNVAGGIRVKETAADLAVAMAIVSSMRTAPLTAETAFIGEVGLAGEIRPVPRMAARLGECARMGVKRVIVPNGTLGVQRAPRGLEIVEARTLFNALDAAL